jgi:hypothetical protein
MDLHGLSNNLLQQRPYDQQLIKKAPKWWEGILQAGAGGASGAASGYAMNGTPGAIAGGIKGAAQPYTGGQ